MSEQWYQFPRIDNFGQIDPQGNYWKPDSNILTPPGYAVTALLDGQVTSSQRTSFGQQTITIRLATPLNNLATHMFYEHMHDATISSGDNVKAGDLVGHANLSGEGAALGFGLYPGDVYGSGPGWNELQQDLAPGGAGLLNPVSLLNSARANGIPVPTGTLANTGSSAGQPNNIFVTFGEKIASILPIPGFVLSVAETASTTPFEIIGAVAIGGIALLIGFIFVSLVGLSKK